jgi:hypothetical protein
MTDRVQADHSDTPARLAGADAPIPALSVADTTLAGLFARARSALLTHGERHETPRGPARSLGGVVLTWTAPERDATEPPRWTRAEIGWYLDTFVHDRPANDPARPAQTGSLVFPYTYAARAAFWDGGWGYLSTLVEAMRAAGKTVEDACASRAVFEDVLAAMGERLHLQTVLALCALHPPDAMRRWLAGPQQVESLLRAHRHNLLARAIEDIRETPASRRAIVSALSYPQLDDALSPRMGIPPYQLFQYLPGEAGGPLSSIHVHRSLDLDGGAPLDFHHDLHWLRAGGDATGRPLGDITVVAHNLHMYERPDEAAGGERESIREWLCRVTDGYESGRGTSRELLARRDYADNVARIWRRWQSET